MRLRKARAVIRRNDVGVAAAADRLIEKVVVHRALVAEAAVAHLIAEAIDFVAADGLRRVSEVDQQAQADVVAHRGALRRCAGCRQPPRQRGWRGAAAVARAGVRRSAVGPVSRRPRGPPRGPPPGHAQRRAAHDAAPAIGPRRAPDKGCRGCRRWRAGRARRSRWPGYGSPCSRRAFRTRRGADHPNRVLRAWPSGCVNSKVLPMNGVAIVEILSGPMPAHGDHGKWGDALQ